MWHWKVTMTLIEIIHPNCITLHAGKQGTHFAKIGALTPMFKKSTTEPKPNLLSCKNNVSIVTFKFRSLNTINQLPKLTASADKQNIDFIYILKHRYYHCKLELKYHDSSNGWTFLFASTWKSYIYIYIYIYMYIQLTLFSLDTVLNTKDRAMHTLYNPKNQIKVPY